MRRLRDIYTRLCETRILENFSMMSLLTIAGTVIGFLVYPFVIRAVGAEAYGTFVAATATASFIRILADYGFSVPCAKHVVEHSEDKKYLSSLVGTIISLRLTLLALSTAVFFAIGLHIDFVSRHKLLFLLGLLQEAGTILFPTWYYQGLKRMRIVTTINLCIRLSAIPFIILLVASPDDITLYAAISCTMSLLAGSTAVGWLVWHDGLHLSIANVQQIKTLAGEATPFFLTYVIENLKDYLLNIAVGKFFGMKDLAAYDLACKIVSIPQRITANINGALFPEVVGKATTQQIRKIFRYETYIGFITIAGIATCGYPAVAILGGEKLLAAYPMLIILSFTVLTRLLVGVYTNFVFLPTGKTYHITAEQTFSLVCSIPIFAAGIVIGGSATTIPLTLTLSTFCEVAYCAYAAKKHGLV